MQFGTTKPLASGADGQAESAVMQPAPEPQVDALASYEAAVLDLSEKMEFLVIHIACCAPQL